MWYAMLTAGNTRDRNSISSFTPINYKNAQPQFVSPSKTLISTALDSDAVYDLPDDVHLEAALPKGTKRGASQAKKGRAVSLGAVWEFNDEEDLQSLGDPIPKRRKAAPNRSKSTKVPSKMISGSWDNGVDAQQDIAEPDNGPNSQLTTPPDSHKKAKRRTASSTSQSKAKRMKPFKNPTISKPSMAEEKGFEDNIPSSKPVSTHRGWTTTEDAVKIAKTTLDKLTAFRYKPSAGSETPTNLPVQRVDEPKLVQDPELQLGAPETGHSSSDYGHVPSFGSLLRDPPFNRSEAKINDIFEDAEVQDAETAHLPATEMLLNHSHGDFFADAFWNVRTSIQAAPINREVDEFQVQQQPQASGRIHLYYTSPQSAPIPSESFPDISASLTEPTQHVTNSFEPTSSEAKILDSVEIDQCDQRVFERFEAEILSTQNRSTIAYIFSEDAIELEQAYDIGEMEVEEEAAAQESFPAARTDSNELHPVILSSNHPQLMGRVTEVQVERSDADDTEATPRDVSKDYESDEFDEGLVDSDLLRVVADAIIPGTQINLKVNEREKGGTLLQSQPKSPTSAPAQNVFASGKPVGLTIETIPEPAAESHLLPSPQIRSSEPDDEFPMDEADEEMFNMPELMTTGIVEQFQAPGSLQYAFGDDHGTGEVYDSSLQFSPPKNRPTMTSLQKVHTDIANTPESPARRLDIEPLPLGEEEDWDFLRSDHVDEEGGVQVSSGHLPGPLQHTTVDGTEGRELSSLGLQVRAHPSDSATTPASATQTDLALIMWILDDRHEYKPLLPFARPDFPTLTRDRSPVTGVSAQTFLRVCFRIGEMFKEGARCEALKQDALVELFARVTFSSREPGTTKQHFQFADLWHDRPPFPNGVLANYKTTGLVESECKAFLGADEGRLTRCLGRLKRTSKSATGWMLHIINIRTTDWEEIKWTKRIVSAGLPKSKTLGMSKL
jgi:hypothetical protein